MRSDLCFFQAETYLLVSLPRASWAGCPALPCDLGRGEPPPGSPHPRNHPWEDPPFLETILGPIMNFFPQHYTTRGNMPMRIQSLCHCLAIFLFFGQKKMCTSALLCFGSHEAHLKRFSFST